MRGSLRVVERLISSCDLTPMLTSFALIVWLVW